jgi:hypothetical protein
MRVQLDEGVERGGWGKNVGIVEVVSIFGKIACQGIRRRMNQNDRTPSRWLRAIWVSYIVYGSGGGEITLVSMECLSTREALYIIVKLNLLYMWSTFK